MYVKMGICSHLSLMNH